MALARAAAVAVGGAITLLLLDHAGVTLSSALTRIETIRGAGPAGLALFVGVYAVATFAMLPASWLQGAAGFLYGAGPGIALAWAASTTFGALCFLASRGRLRGRVGAWLARGGGQGRLASLDRTIARRGLLAVVLLRLSPLAPYNIINYLLGLTAVKQRTYLVGSALGGLVPVIVYGLLGATVSDLSALADASRDTPAAAWAVLGTTLIASLGIAEFVRRALKEPAID